MHVGLELQFPPCKHEMSMSPMRSYPSLHSTRATSPYVVPSGVLEVPLPGVGSPQSET